MNSSEKVNLLRQVLWEISEKMLVEDDDPNWTKKIYYKAHDALKATSDNPELYDPIIAEITP